MRPSRRSQTRAEPISPNGADTRLSAREVTIGYDTRTIARDLSVAVPDGQFTVIVGANACGKSTLLRALSRLLMPSAGQVVLDGRALSAYPTKEVARKIGLLPQSAIAPEGITVHDLVSRGRYPHQTMFNRWSQDDEAAVQDAMTATRVASLADRAVDELSGGQRQRVWVAMAMAQQTPILLLDEPTTFLDITHQIEILDLLAQLNKEKGQTIVAVLHDLNHASRYADHIIAMREGAIVAKGAPSRIVDPDLVRTVFDLDCVIIEDPVSHTPLVVPRGRHIAEGKANTLRKGDAS